VISVIVPVHDEERTVALLYEELDSALQPLDQPWEVVFVDDGSTDGSFSALTRLHDAHDNVRVIRLRRNFGKATALSAGFAHAEGEIGILVIRRCVALVEAAEGLVALEDVLQRAAVPVVDSHRVVRRDRPVHEGEPGASAVPFPKLLKRALTLPELEDRVLERGMIRDGR